MNEGGVQAQAGGWAYLQWIGNSVQREEGTKGEELSNKRRHGAHCRCGQCICGELSASAGIVMR